MNTSPYAVQTNTNYFSLKIKKYSQVSQTMVKILWLVGILLYTHKQLTDNCALIEVARQLGAVSDERREHFGAFKYLSVFSSHLIYQILMIINIPTNTLGSAHVSSLPLPFKN